MFTPSAMGAVLYTFVSALIIILNQLSFIQAYLQIPRDAEFLGMFAKWLEKLLTSSIGQSRTETLVVGLFWAFVGLGVYLFLRGVVRFIEELDDGFDTRRYLWPQGSSRNHALMQAVKRGLFSIAAFLALLFVVLGPFARLLDGAVFIDFIGPIVALQLVFWFIFLWMTLHLCVVLLRLTALRPRLLG